jgi:hypothetical protein
MSRRLTEAQSQALSIAVFTERETGGPVPVSG